MIQTNFVFGPASATLPLYVPSEAWLDSLYAMDPDIVMFLSSKQDDAKVNYVLAIRRTTPKGDVCPISIDGAFAWNNDLAIITTLSARKQHPGESRRTWQKEVWTTDIIYALRSRNIDYNGGVTAVLTRLRDNEALARQKVDDRIQRKAERLGRKAYARLSAVAA